MSRSRRDRRALRAIERALDAEASDTRFGPDGHHVATVADDHVVRVWRYGEHRPSASRGCDDRRYRTRTVTSWTALAPYPSRFHTGRSGWLRPARSVARARIVVAPAASVRVRSSHHCQLYR
jgi:hypothetical protein